VFQVLVLNKVAKFEYSVITTKDIMGDYTGWELSISGLKGTDSGAVGACWTINPTGMGLWILRRHC
jgi:hypothetical protein